MKQLVSILIPAYNSEKWIASCIKSALCQTWPYKEIIIVDDGSSDATFNIAKSYVSNMVKVIFQENQGACAARNRALSTCQGDYIQWLDVDDLLEANKIEIQMKEAEPGHLSEVLLSSAWGNFIICPERTIFSPSSLWEDLDPAEWLYRKIDRNEWMAPETWLVSRKLTNKAGPWNENLSRDQDGEYFCRVLSGATKIKFFPESRVYKRSGILKSISSSSLLSDRKIESTFISLQLHIDTLLSMENSIRTREAVFKLLNRWAIYFYPENIHFFNRLQSIADNFGLKMSIPKLRWKYRWLIFFFGWNIAKKAQFSLPSIRIILKKNYERLLCLRYIRS